MILKKIYIYIDASSKFSAFFFYIRTAKLNGKIPILSNVNGM